jgi:hypothetical protein
MRTVVEDIAYANQPEIPVPGGFTPTMVDVIRNGSTLVRGVDYDDTNGISIKPTTPFVAGESFKVIAWTPNQTVLNAVGQMAPYRNKLINGNFDIWQRGTSLSAGTGAPLLADRWIDGAGGTTVAPSRQTFTLGQTDVPGEPSYFHRSVVASSAGANNFAQLVQRIESARTLAGQYATVSFWIKADSVKTVAVEFSRSYGTGGSPSAAETGIGASKFAVTSTWQKITTSVLIPSISGKTLGTNGDDYLALNLWFDAGSTYNTRTNSLGQQSGTFDVAQIQVEAGTYATQFEYRPPSIELQMCQRYYMRWKSDGSSPLQLAVTSGATNSAIIILPLLVQMRATPSMLTSGVVGANYSGAAGPTATQWTMGSVGVVYHSVSSGTMSVGLINQSNFCALSASGMTLSSIPNFAVLGSSMWVDASAEL